MLKHKIMIHLKQEEKLDIVYIDIIFILINLSTKTKCQY